MKLRDTCVTETGKLSDSENRNIGFSNHLSRVIYKDNPREMSCHLNYKLSLIN